MDRKETSMAAIVTLTMNPAIDVATSVQSVRPRDKLRCERPARSPGGGGVNVARVVRRLDGDGCALWTCGGATGETLRQLLDAEQCPHKPLRIQNPIRENLTVRERDSGHQFRFAMPGPKISDDEARNCVETVRTLGDDVVYLVLSGSLPEGVPDDFYAQLVQAAPDHVRVMLDTSGTELTRGIEPGVFLLKPNLRELEELAGRDISGDGEIEEVSRQLIHEGKANVIVTSLGAGGAVLVADSQVRRVRAPTVKIRSKVGAGDSMAAGIIVRLAAGDDLLSAVRYGVAAGAAAVSTPGTELCQAKDVERLYEDFLGRETDGEES
jgi:6-phosphofructokinase 2